MAEYWVDSNGPDKQQLQPFLSHKILERDFLSSNQVEKYRNSPSSGNWVVCDADSVQKAWRT